MRTRHLHARRFLLVAIAAALAVLCAPVTAGAKARVLTGSVISGVGADAMPISGADVALYTSSAKTARVVATARTDASGSFSITLPTGTRYRYLVARAGDHRVLVALLGTTTPSRVTVNELTTVAAAYTTAQLASGSSISGTTLQLQAAAGMAANLVSPVTGSPSAVITSPPNGNETNAWRSLGSLANMLVPCTSNGACDELLAATQAGAKGTTWSEIGRAHV